MVHLRVRLPGLDSGAHDISLFNPPCDLARARHGAEALCCNRLPAYRTNKPLREILPITCAEISFVDIETRRVNDPLLCTQAESRSMATPNLIARVGRACLALINHRGTPWDYTYLDGRYRRHRLRSYRRLAVDVVPVRGCVVFV